MGLESVIAYGAALSLPAWLAVEEILRYRRTRRVAEPRPAARKTAVVAAPGLRVARTRALRSRTV
jgi:hypothetical protein